MAKGKSSKGTNYTSKGQRPNVKASVLKAVRKDRTNAEKIQNIIRGYLKHQNPWVTVSNPNTNETNKRFIRVRANDLWGPSKENYYKMKVA